MSQSIATSLVRIYQKLIEFFCSCFFEYDHNKFELGQFQNQVFRKFKFANICYFQRNALKNSIFRNANHLH